MTMVFKNPQIVGELFDVEQVKYFTWVYNERYDFYYDIILTDKELTIIGKDIISTHVFSKISSCVAYFGDTDDEYEENYNEMDFDWMWSYGDGDISITFSDWSGKDWRIMFDAQRFLEAKQLFIELKKKL